MQSMPCVASQLYIVAFVLSLHITGCTSRDVGVDGPALLAWGKQHGCDSTMELRLSSGGTDVFAITANEIKPNQPLITIPEALALCHDQCWVSFGRDVCERSVAHFSPGDAHVDTSPAQTGARTIIRQKSRCLPDAGTARGASSWEGKHLARVRCDAAA